jgi:pyruvate dehydrogenase E1 component
MPDFWEFPTVSMGLTAINSIYQAAFNRYLHNRGIKDTSQQHVWAFLGDGEMGEVESLGAIGVAAREELDNLTFVVNCNLQQLDGPVRGNGKIIQELESYFRGAGWNVIKVVWGREWDALLARDVDGALVNQMNRRRRAVPDLHGGDRRVHPPALLRQRPAARQDGRAPLRRGHPQAAPRRARLSQGLLGVQGRIRAQRAADGDPRQDGQGVDDRLAGGQERNPPDEEAHQDDLKTFRDRLYLPISDEAIDDSDVAPFYHPGADSDEIQYMLDRRRQLGGPLPERRVKQVPVKLPGDKVYSELKQGSGKQSIATTMAFVRLLRDLMRDPEIGKRLVPIAPDEYRTFGMDSMFPTAKVYSPHGQTYESVDRKLLLAYKESQQGQLLHEGISEAGAMASATAAGTSYATHGEPMIPIYIFYSMFGFQRTGDSIWAMTDQLGRGFLLGATAGRTTLTGEGLQHADGHSPLLARTNPSVVHYDPAFAFELSHVVQDGLRRMYGSSEEHPDGESVVFYLTIYNEPTVQPAEPEDLDVNGLLRGMYLYRAANGGDDRTRIQLLASGISVPWALKAADILSKDYDVAADVWSVTSWNELAREAEAVERWNLNHPSDGPRTPYVTERLSGTHGPALAVSDYMRAVQDQIARWVPNDWQSLGADGYGFADTRAAARRYFQIDAESIVVSALQTLARRGEVKPETVTDAFSRFKIDDPTAVADVEQEGSPA